VGALNRAGIKPAPTFDCNDGLLSVSRVAISLAGSSLLWDLPPQWEVMAASRPAPLPALKDIPKALRERLEQPTGCLPLSSAGVAGKKIAIVIDDDTRPTPTHLLLPELIKYLQCHGAKKEDMTLFVALGVHKGMASERLARKTGDSAILGLRWENHDSSDRDKHVDLGVTKRGTRVLLNKGLMRADMIMCLGLIEPHPLAGFGGGLKMILPGMAHKDTIAENHMQGVRDSKRFNYVGAYESPIRQDLEEGALMLNKKIFIINVVQNDALEVCRIVAGDPILAHREGANVSEAISSCLIDEPADVAITVSHPMDADLRQGAKCIANASPGVREGGIILAFLECVNGLGDIRGSGSPIPINYGLMRMILKAIGDKNIFSFANAVKKVEVEERFLANFSMHISRKNAVFLYSPNLPSGTGSRIGLFRQFDEASLMFKAAGRSAPKKAKVLFLPHGGASYLKVKSG